VKALVLRLDAPLISFGGPMVDQNGIIQTFPGLSMLSGLLANALGWDRRDYEKLGRLQERVRFAARVDRPGEALLDYQTVDLGADWMRPETSGWTTRGRIAARGGASAEGTHQRYRHYRADSVHTVVLTLLGDEPPSLDDVAQALREPARPLFIGRKCCLPAAPLLLEVLEADSLVSVLATMPRAHRADRGLLRVAWWEGDDATAAIGESRVVAVSDEREWRNGVHVGRRLVREGHVNPPEAPHA
jgi:CRISPR system Cascade subunit CasD